MVTARTWLITGARGFLGTNAGAALTGRVDLVGQARQSAPSTLYREIVGLDLRDPEPLDDLIRRVRPAVIVNAAAISGHETCANDPDQAWAVNVTATQRMARAAADIGSTFVHISTDAVFSGATGDYREDDSVEPFSVYGETKLAGEEAVRSALEQHLILRTNFFGWSETGRKSVLEFFVNALRGNEHINGYPDFIVTSLYVPSLVETIWQLVERHERGTFHVASRDALSKYDFGVEVARRFGLDESLIARLGPTPGTHATSRSRDLSLNTDRIAAVLANPMQSQAEGIAQAYDDESTVGGRVRRSGIQA